MKKLKNKLVNWIYEILDHKLDNFFTCYVLNEDGKDLCEICLTFKPTKGDLIEVDNTSVRVPQTKDTYFIFEVETVQYSQRGFTGRITGKRIKF